MNVSNNLRLSVFSFFSDLAWNRIDGRFLFWWAGSEENLGFWWLICVEGRSLLLCGRGWLRERYGGGQCSQLQNSATYRVTSINFPARPAEIQATSTVQQDVKNNHQD